MIFTILRSLVKTRQSITDSSQYIVAIDYTIVIAPLTSLCNGNTDFQNNETVRAFFPPNPRLIELIMTLFVGEPRLGWVCEIHVLREAAT